MSAEPFVRMTGVAKRWNGRVAGRRLCLMDEPLSNLDAKLHWSAGLRSVLVAPEAGDGPYPF